MGPDPVSRGLKENETEIEQLEERQMAPQVERTMRQMIQQMDVLTITVSILEQRLTMMESKMTDMMLDQNIRRLTETDINLLDNAKSPPPSTPRDPLIDTINTTIE